MVIHPWRAIAAICICLLFSSCGSRSIKDPPDTTRPAVTATSPVTNATTASITAPIQATFSESINSSTLNTATFTLAGVLSGSVISGTVSCDNPCITATFTPSAPLSHDTTYTASIGVDVKDPAGNSLGGRYTWSFTTIPSPGSLDKTFGTGGLVRTPVLSSNDVATAVALQADGKIVVAGYSTYVTALTATISVASNYLTLVRYNTNGSPDATFGAPLNSGGKITDLPGTAMAVAIQSDGKILAGGTSGTGADLLIVRYTSDGQLDPTFGSGGQTAIDAGGTTDAVTSLAVQNDGKIVIVGNKQVTTPSGTVNSIALMRLASDGTSSDSTFNSGNIVTVDSYDNSWATSVQIQTDGKILVAGYFKNAGGPATPLIIRYNQAGTVDSMFSGTGAAAPSIGQDARLSNIVLLPDGKILATGATTNAANNTSDIVLLQFLADGSLDTAFGPGGTGIVSTDFSSSEESGVALATDADGKIMVAAYYRKTSGQPQTYDFALFRYTRDGSLDTTFGNGFGMVHSDFGGNLNDLASCMVVQREGKIVVAGAVANSSNYDIGVARYWP